MQIKNLHQPFEIEFLEAEEYSAKEHSNTFFEMVFVLEGKGVQSINNHQLPYSNDKLFLIFPNDRHGFEVHAPTKFFFIRFNNSYLKTQSNEWIQKLEFILHRHNHLPGCILKNVSDKPFIRSMVESLMREQINNHPHKQEVIQQIINTMLTIAARNITLMIPAVSNLNGEKDAIHLLNYIHQNIYQPEQLKADKLAAFFNVAPTYISEYFKNKTGQNLQQYIADYRMKLLETRLRFTDMQINEIVYEFGFTDASHLNRLFRKYKGMSPSEYRKS
jgi:AraC-like DNA-binding protein